MFSPRVQEVLNALLVQEEPTRPSLLKAKRIVDVLLPSGPPRGLMRSSGGDLLKRLAQSLDDDDIVPRKHSY